MGSLDHPIAIVTAATRRETNGCLAGFFTRSGIEPPRLTVYLAKREPTCAVARKAPHLMVHVLNRRQHDLAACFASREDAEVDPLEQVRWRPGPDGRTPRLVDVDAWIFGKVVSRHDTGDHLGFVLDPLRVREPRRLRQLGSRDVHDLVTAP